MIKLKPAELRTREGDPEIKKKLKKNPIFIVCDNILDTYNVGAIFRLADAVAATEVLLCGVTEFPPNIRIKRASINTTEWVNWQYFPKTTDAIEYLRKNIKDIQIIAVEQDKRSVPFSTFNYKFPIALIVSNETTGAQEDVLSAVDGIVELPMYGVNVSLNVMVSLGIVLYKVAERLPR
jgi:23S rRNA (guanosine2251-2'-O)-methyltransferase